MVKKVTAWLLVFAFVASPVFAATPSVWKKEGAPYGTTIAKKFAFGLTNVVLGWTEILTEPYEAVRDHKNVLVGIKDGLWNGIADEIGGAIHLITFPCPKTDVPLPQGGIVLPCCKK